MRTTVTLCLAAALLGTALAEDCLRPRLIKSFRDIDDQGLTLVEVNKTKWRAEFGSTCFGIKNAFGLVADTFGACFQPGDAVIYTLNGNKERCVVSKLTKIPKEPAAE